MLPALSERFIGSNCGAVKSSHARFFPKQFPILKRLKCIFPIFQGTKVTLSD